MESDLLYPFPALRSLRDAILIRDPDAKRAGVGLLTRVLIAASFQAKLPPDRLLRTDDAALLIGVEQEDFDLLAYKAQIKPVHVLSKGAYWRARDVYSLAEQ